MGIETALIIAAIGATVAGVGTAVASSRSSKRAAKQQQNIAQDRSREIESQRAADIKAASDAESIANQRIPAARRLSLISTSPSGTLGRANVGRSKLFGN